MTMAVSNTREMTMAQYRNDPRWLPARYAGKCSKCGETFERGRMIFYYPIGKRALSGGCAVAAGDKFDAAVRDEQFYCGQ